MGGQNNQGSNLFRQANSFFGSEFWTDFKDLLVGSGPLANLYESEKELICVVDLPGLQVKDVEVYVHYRTLKITGNINLELKGYHLVEEEMFQGAFERVIELPHPVLDQPVNAYYRRGMLIIQMTRLFSKEEGHHKVHVHDFEG